MVKLIWHVMKEAETETTRPGYRESILALSPPFLIGIAFGFGKIVRDCSLTCNVGYQFFPLVILVIGILSVPLSVLSVRLAKRWGYKIWQTASLIATAMILLFLWAAAYFSVSQYNPGVRADSGLEFWQVAVKLSYILFYIWIGVVGTVIAPNIKGTIYKVFSFRKRAKALTLTGASIISGGLIGSIIASRLVSYLMKTYDLRYEMARDSLIPAMGIIILLIIPLIFIIDRKYPGEPYSGKIDPGDDGLKLDEAPSDRLSFSMAVRQIAQNPKLKRMAGLIMTAGAAETVLFYLFYWLITLQTSGDNGRTLFFANFYLWLHASTLLFLIFGANRIISKYGLLIALITTPVAMVFGTSFLIFHTAMIVIYIMRIVLSTLEDSIYYPGIDRTILDAARTHSPIIQRIFHGLIGRIGRGIGAVVTGLLAVILGLSFQVMSLVFLVLLLLWILWALSLRPYLAKKSF
jgi:ATP/ADP translocase